MKGKAMVILVILVLSSFSVAAYPIIISNEGINTTQAKELVYSIPEKYFKYVNVVEFVNKPLYNSGQFNSGWYNVLWNNKHKCYDGKIQIY